MEETFNRSDSQVTVTNHDPQCYEGSGVWIALISLAVGIRFLVARFLCALDEFKHKRASLFAKLSLGGILVRLGRSEPAEDTLIVSHIVVVQQLNNAGKEGSKVGVCGTVSLRRNQVSVCFRRKKASPTNDTHLYHV